MKNIIGFFELGEEGKQEISMQEFKNLCTLADNFNGSEVGATLKTLVSNKNNKNSLHTKVDYDYFVGIKFK